MRWHVGKRPQEPVFEFRTHPEPEPPQQKPEGILALQRSSGNQSVQKSIPQRVGDAIPEGERQQLEGAFGRDLSEVRIHRNQEAAAEQGATAFTSGRDIYFAPGAYGSETLAHEVAHVIQQHEASQELPVEDVGLERQAVAASTAVASSHAVDMPSVGAAPELQRQPAPGTQSSSLNLLPTYRLTLDKFDNDAFQLSGDHKAKLDQFAERAKSTLSSSPNSIISIIGFADAPGTELHNLGLGQERANAARDYLIARGVAADALHASSLGEHSPIVETKGHEARNRRVEIEVLERGSFKSPQAIAPTTKSLLPQIPAKNIDLKFHPKPPSPSEEFTDRLRLIDRAIREAQEAEKANSGSSLADRFGRVGRDVAKKMGLPQWMQDHIESLAQEVPSRGGQAVVDQIAGDRSLDTNTKNAVKAVIDALMRMKVK